MHNSLINQPSTRREFMKTGAKGIGLIAFSQFAPAFLTRSVAAELPNAERDRSILVMIQLAGGNDGLNTLVPYTDDNYFRLRPNLALQAEDRIAISDSLAFHKGCNPMAQMYQEGKLGIVQNVGYPNPNRSHFRSSEIWETASNSNENLYTGWLGRYLDNACSGSPTENSPQAVHLTSEIPQALHADNPLSIFGTGAYGSASGAKANRDLLGELAGSGDMEHSNASYLQHTLMDALVTEERVDQIFNAYKTSVEYPRSKLAQSLKRIAALIAAGMDTRVYFASLGGFDTHVNQLNNHGRLMIELAEAMQAFQSDLESKGLQDQVLTMTFSEFGRRPSENGSKGTDHGTSAPLFVMGSKVKNNLIGTAPSLDVGHNKDLSYSTDFRQVYATVLEKWLDCKQSETVLGAKFDSLSFL